MAKIKYNQIEDINLLDEKITIATNDVFLIEDSEDLFNVKRFKATNLPSGGSSTFAFTDPTVNSEGTDYLPLYDDSDSNNPKKSTIASIITDNNIVITSDLTGFLSSGDNISLLTNDSGYITGYTVTEGDVTAHQAALTITESQISDLSHFTPTDLPTDYSITLSTVATTNDYNDLDNLPSLFTGTVTSVEISGSDGIEVDSGSPITTSGTIALGLNKTKTLAFLNVEDGADVTDATNVDAAGATMNADTDVSTNSWVLDEDDMSSDSATKVPTQQSVKAYVDNFPTPTENQIKAKRTSATVSGTHNIDPTAFTHHHITMTADTDFTFINVPTNTEDVFKCKLRLTGAFAPSWTQAGLQVFGDDYDGTKWNDILVEMWLDGTIKGLLIFQQRETA